MAPVMDAVSFLHQQAPPIIHRDIKPANIIAPDNDGGTMLVDFGIAKEYSKDSTTTAIRHCSPGYAAPEQYATGTNPRTDIYGLGATCYTLLTGTVPTDALFRMTQLGGRFPDPLEPADHLVSSLPKAVSDALQRAMAINGGDRFASVDEFWEALQGESNNDGGLPVPLPLSEAQTEPHVPYPVASVRQLPNTPTVAIYQQQRVSERKRLFPIFAVFAFALLIAGIVVATSFLPALISGRNATPTAPAGAAQQITATVIATPTSGVTPTNTPPPTATSTPPPPQYPALATEYNGTIIDQFTNPFTQSTLNLSQIKQNGTDFTGYLTLGSGLQGNGNFQGKIAADKSLHFLVEACCTHLPLYFEGKIQPDQSISGTYCAYENGKCANREGFGIWSVTPKTPPPPQPSK
jgi:serine/threonine protein kinase